MFKLFSLFSLIVLLFTACVPAKKFNELSAKEKACSEELERLRKSSVEFEAMAKDLGTKYKLAVNDVNSLVGDTTSLGNEVRVLTRDLEKINTELSSMQEAFDKFKNLNAKETAKLYADLELKNKELQKKEDDLLMLEAQLNSKEKLLKEREARVKELEEIIRKKDEAVRLLKDKIAQALRGFENQGLTVEERNGRIYVSLEAKLLFGSVSTAVGAEGQDALKKLGKVLETESELEIVVEGHTDTDKMSGSTHPTSNWELSVLRATAVVEILLANSTMNPKQIMAAGRGEFHPLDPSNKAKNRRIEVIISPNLNELFEIISND